MNKDDETEVFVIGKEGNIIFGDQPSTLLQQVTKTMDTGVLQSLSGKTLEITLDHKEYMMAAVYSDILNGNFVWVSSFKPLYKVFASVGNISFLYGIVLLIVLLSTAIYISQRAAKPVDELMINIACNIRIAGK